MEESSTSSDGSNLVLYDVTSEGIALITFNRPRRLNGWSGDVIDGFIAALNRANQDPACKVAIMTGKGRYYSSGADFGGQMGPMLPSTLRKFAASKNESIFEAFIGFQKPLIIAAQGPAVGGAVTSACLADYIVCSSHSSWHTPFRALGITAEGCSEYTFPLKLAPGGAEAMLVEGRKVSAQEALELGLVDEVVDSPEEVFDAAQATARRFIANNQTRWETIKGFLPEIERLGVRAFVANLREINRTESERLSWALIGQPFFEAQMKFAEKNGNSKMAWAFWLMKTLQPILSRL